MVDLLVFLIFLFFLFFGITRPHVAFCGYIWVDIFNPQKISFGFLSSLPMSLTMAIICLLSLLLNIKKLQKPADFHLVTLLCILVIWITITTVFSYYPEYAWFKWDVAIKIILMTVMFFFVINTKEQLELCFTVFALSASYYMMSAGVKTILGGGGYGASLITAQGNSGISESSTLAMVAVMLIPMVLFFKNNTILFVPFRNSRIIWWAPLVLIIATIIGTQARTGLVALLVFIIVKIMTSKNKARNIFLIAMIAATSYTFVVSDDWKDRMGTITNASQDSSATGRMLVWQWTFDFAKTHPVGGGFNAYLANAGLWQLYSDVPINDDKAKAFHSIYFEMMGEHGFVGLFIFLLIIYLAWGSNRKMVKRNKDLPDGRWLSECGKMLNHCIIIFCISGAFIGVAFQPFLYYIIAFSVILKKIEVNSNA